MVPGSKRLLSRALIRQGLRPIIYGLAFDRSIEFLVDALSVRFSYNREACIQLIAGRFLPCALYNWRRLAHCPPPIAAQPIHDTELCGCETIWTN